MARQLLGSTFPLHEIDDVEAFTGTIVKRSGLSLTTDEREQLHVYLLEECWLLSLRYEPGIVRGGFPVWAGRILRLRTVDWIRSYRGRTRWQFADGNVYERERPQLVSLDDPDLDRLGQPVGDGGLDDDVHRVSDQLRALDKRSRRPGRGDERLGDEAAYCSPPRARAAGLGQARPHTAPARLA